MTPNATSLRRAFVLPAVLLLAVLGVVAATTTLTTAGARIDEASVAISSSQARALASSGMLAATTELASQRQALLEGEQPDLPSQWIIFETDAEVGIARLVDLTPDADGEIFSESAKLDLNRVPRESLEALGLLTPTLVDRIIEARPFFSVEQLASVDGVTPELLYGASVGANDLRAFDIDMPTDDAPPSQTQVSEVDETPIATSALVDVLTVFSADANVQAGLDGDSDNAGNRRINLDQPWSDRLGQAIADRYDRGTARVVRGLFAAGISFDKPSSIIEQLRRFNVGTDDWTQVLDVFTTSDDEYVLGLVDINTASIEVLAAVPGFDDASARSIADTRETLDPQTRRDVVWPVLTGAVTPEAFQTAVDFITTRSLQWRVRIEVGIEDATDEPDSRFTDDPRFGDSFASREPASSSQLEAELSQLAEASQLRGRRVYEAVIDIASERPRVAYFRDVTLLPLARSLYVDQRDAVVSLDDDWLDMLEQGFAAEFEQSELDAFADDEPTTARDERSSAGRREEFTDRRTEFASSVEAEADTPAEPTQSQAVDRRIGRWNTREPQP
ncbi:MAG: hypothetical protein AAF747_09285 [Planctomycetota bacterium]